MNSRFRHDPRPDLAFDLLGSAIVLAIVWGTFTMLFAEPSRWTAAEIFAPLEMSVSFDLYDSVMTEDEDWQMLASR